MLIVSIWIHFGLEEEKVQPSSKIGPMPLAKKGDSKSSSTDSGLQMEESSVISETTSL